MYAVIFGLTLGGLEYLVDRLRGKPRSKVSYAKDMILAGISINLIRLLGVL